MPDELLLNRNDRHVRLFTARLEEEQLVADPSKLTLDLDPTTIPLGAGRGRDPFAERFKDLVAATPARISAKTKPAQGSAPSWRHDPAIAAAGELKVQPGCPGP